MKKQQNKKTIYILPCITVWAVGILILLGCMVASRNAVCAYSGCGERTCENSLFCRHHTPEARRMQKYHIDRSLQNAEAGHGYAANRNISEEQGAGLCLIQ